MVVASLSAAWVYTVVYDGECDVCGRLVSFWSRWDRAGRLEILPSQTPGIRERFSRIPESAYDDSLQVVGRDGRAWSGVEAFRRVFAVLPGAHALSAFLGWPVVRPLAAAAYRWFAAHRRRFGCSSRCSTRPPPRP